MWVLGRRIGSSRSCLRACRRHASLACSCRPDDRRSISVDATAARAKPHYSRLSRPRRSGRRWFAQRLSAALHFRRERRRIDFATVGAKFIAIVSFTATLPGCGFFKNSSAKSASQHLILCNLGHCEQREGFVFGSDLGSSTSRRAPSEAGLSH
jgi:hypothetical protein